ncbi:MAG: zinc metalloprotease HtpX [Candidatus Binatia bacterium]
MSNLLKTTLLLGALTGLLLLFGELLGGTAGVQIAFLLAVVMNFGAYWFSDKIVLRAYGAQPIEEREAPDLYSIVRTLAQRAGMPMPRIYLIPSEGPNAFATGRNPEHAVVAVTSGILRILDRNELEGVLAHELGHVRNRDILVSSIAATLAGAIMMLANMVRWAAIFGMGGRDERDGGNVFVALAMAVLAPIAAMLVQMAVSRSREYGADETGAKLCGRPEALASALLKISHGSERMPMEAGPATAHLFIVNPLNARSLMALFSTHPPVEERVARLRRMRIGL